MSKKVPWRIEGWEEDMSNKGYKSERLQWQLAYFIDRRKFKTREAADQAAKDAKANFLATGRSIAGVRLVARWRNPDNRNPLHADWKTTDDTGQSLKGFWKTITQRVGRA